MAQGASNLTKFTSFMSEDDAIAMLERLRWPNGAACPHCGGADPYRLTVRTKTPGKRTARQGLWKCSQCRKQFTVKVGTIFESSHIPVSKWLMALHLISASKKGMSALQFKRMLGVTYRAAWFMAMRLRHAMAAGSFRLEGVVEVDETFIGTTRQRAGAYGYTKKDGDKTYPTYHGKTPVMALVERGGRAKAFPITDLHTTAMRQHLVEHLDPKNTHMMTDEFPQYPKIAVAEQFKRHEMINHGRKEYVRGNVHTNTVEGFFSLLKRGITGTFHHVSRGHLHRYCDEFAFRYTHRQAVGVDDEQRTKFLIAATEGKRLTFKQPSRTSAA